MKFLTRFLTLACLLCGLNAFAAGNIINATVAITNSIGTSNYETITINGNLLTWTNQVFVPAAQILTNNTPAGSATNLFVQLVDFPNAGISTVYGSSTSVVMSSFPGQLLTVTVSAGYATVTYSTNYLTNAYVVRMPILVEQPGQQTNIASLMATALDKSTNVLSDTDNLLSNYVSRAQVQTITANKIFTGTSNYFASAFITGASMTNATNFGNSFSSPGTGNNSLQLGVNAQAIGQSSAAIGNGSVASAFHALAVGNSSAATVDQATAIGQRANALDTNTTALGAQTTVSAGHTNSTAVGFGATTTGPNQVMIGYAGGGGIPAISAVINNYLQVLGGLTVANGITNLFLTGTNYFPAGSDISFGRFPVTSLANGNNAAVPVGTNVFIEVSGPSGAFTINGINGQPNRDGKQIIIKNATGQTMTIANQSGTDPTAANRILTGLSADEAFTNNPGMVTLIYDGNASRWLIQSHN